MSSDATSRDVNLELRHAVYRGDLDAVRRMLDEGGCVTDTFFFPGLARDSFHDFTEDFQMTILTLWRKATNPTIPMLRLLLEHGADASNASDENPLHWACTAGNLEAVRLLLDHGADVDGRAPRTSTQSSTYSSSRVVSSPASAPRIAARNAGACGSIEIWSRSSRRFWW